MSDPKQEKAYFENMSAAFARKAAKVATVMHNDINNPPIWGIWKRIEFEVLRRSGLVDQVSFNFSLYIFCLVSRMFTNKLTHRLLPSTREMSEIKKSNGLLR